MDEGVGEADGAQIDDSYARPSRGRYDGSSLLRSVGAELCDQPQDRDHGNLRPDLGELFFMIRGESTGGRC